MTTLIQQFQRIFMRRAKPVERADPEVPVRADPEQVAELDLAPHDPLFMLLHSAPGVLDLDTLRLESPFLAQLRADGTRLIVPLRSQGELVGILTLGSRRSEQEYASDDKAFLRQLALHAAPALRVAQLVRQQRAEARERERIAQELKVARLIQQTLLPRSVPQIAGWEITPYYEPAREVGGDFYDFIALPNGHLGLVIADVTDKGVPAALVMATTRSILRAAATRLEAPGAVLARVNDMLVPDIPPNMFVTCFYAVLDPATGRLQFANAGHDVPYWRSATGALHELRARGMPLGLMEGMIYEADEVQIGPGDHLLLYSDGLVEAHNPRRDMFSFERLADLVAAAPQSGAALIAQLLAELAAFTGAGWVQEDDITLLAVACHALPAQVPDLAQAASMVVDADGVTWQQLAELVIPSAPDNERLAMEHVATVVAPLGLAPRQLERLKTAVAEATMNAMEHGNRYRADQPTRIWVRRTADVLSIQIADYGTGPTTAPELPDLAAKLAEAQTPRGWGLHLIRHMVDDLHEHQIGEQHIVELRIKLSYQY